MGSDERPEVATKRRVRPSEHLVSDRALLAVAKLEVDALETVCQLMEAEEVTRAELARRLRVTPPAITMLLRGTKSPTLRRLAEIAHVLGYELHVEARRVR